jgi:threonine/homoserine/homoserine lactone efflux protein
MTESITLWHYLLPGITFGFAAAAQPGPLSIYLISRTLQTGWKKTFPAIFAPLLSDGPIALVCLLILGNLSPDFLQYIRVAGGFFILYLAFRAAKAWKKDDDTVSVLNASPRRTLFDATLVNLLNPGPYLGWSLVVGPMLLKGWKENPLNGISLLTGFYLTMFMFTTLVIIIFDQARERGPKLQRFMLGVSAICLTAFAIYQLIGGGIAILD